MSLAQHGIRSLSSKIILGRETITLKEDIGAVSGSFENNVNMLSTLTITNGSLIPLGELNTRHLYTIDIADLGTPPNVTYFVPPEPTQLIKVWSVVHGTTSSVGSIAFYFGNSLWGASVGPLVIADGSTAGTVDSYAPSSFLDIGYGGGYIVQLVSDANNNRCTLILELSKNFL